MDIQLLSPPSGHLNRHEAFVFLFMCLSQCQQGFLNRSLVGCSCPACLLLPLAVWEQRSCGRPGQLSGASGWNLNFLHSLVAAKPLREAHIKGGRRRGPLIFLPSVLFLRRGFGRGHNKAVVSCRAVELIYNCANSDIFIKRHA